MNRPSHELLMRYADGELSPAELAELEATLENDPAAAAIVAGIDQVGDVVRALADRQRDGADGIADAVMARIEADERRATEAPPESGARPIPGWTFPVVAAGLAAAAAAAIWLATPNETPAPVARSVPMVQPTEAFVPPPQPALPEPEGEEITPSAAIESVDFGSHNGAIFMVSAGNEATPVVWLTDDVAESGGRTEPL